MAKIIDSVVESQKINYARPIWKAALIGIIAGLFYWGLSKLLQRYGLSLEIAGNVATILTAVFGIILLIIYKIEQPLIIAVASAASLWGVTMVTNGLADNEVLLWMTVLYGMGYAVYFWVTRYTNVFVVLILTLIIVLVMRLIAVL